MVLADKTARTALKSTRAHLFARAAAATASAASRQPRSSRPSKMTNWPSNARFSRAKRLNGRPLAQSLDQACAFELVVGEFPAATVAVGLQKTRIYPSLKLRPSESG